jgi:transcriptional regulator GlxA family with amidase domain
MRIAYILFNNFTLLDFIGVYDAVLRLRTMNYIPDLQWDMCALTDKVSDELGLTLLTNKSGGSLEGYDAVILPGGVGTKSLQHDPDFIGWIRTASAGAWKISVCTGSLLLGAAGFLKNRKATTHFDYYETLQQYCKEVVADRVVEDGNVITAGAVSSSIDLGLFLCHKWAGAEAAANIRRRMDYRG